MAGQAAATVDDLEQVRREVTRVAEAALEDLAEDGLWLGVGDGWAEDGPEHAGERNSRDQGAAANAAALAIVIGVDRDHLRHARVAARGQPEGDRAADRFADDYGASDLARLKQCRRRVGEVAGRVPDRGRAGLTMPGQVHGDHLGPCG